MPRNEIEMDEKHHQKRKKVALEKIDYNRKYIRKGKKNNRKTPTMGNFFHPYREMDEKNHRGTKSRWMKNTTKNEKKWH